MHIALISKERSSYGLSLTKNEPAYIIVAGPHEICSM